MDSPPPLDMAFWQVDNVMRSHGRGLHFMRTMANEMHVERGGSRLRLVFLCMPGGH